MKYKGFTLIEVLIVIIVIGILATLLLPQMGTMAERARSAEAKNMIGALRTLLTAHYMEADGWPANMLTNEAINTTLGESIDRGESLFNYDITATGENMQIVGARNNRRYATGTSWATVTAEITPAGGVVGGRLTTTWSTATPDPPDP